VFYAARALYPDSALSLTQYLDACFGVANLIAEGGIDNTFTVGALRDDLFGQLGVLAKEQGQAGFAVLDILTFKDSTYAEGIIKVLEEETNEQTLIMEPIPD